MAMINVLDSSIYNRIAAGEVVERPYSVVKELVENALDAGADRISVEIRDGGISSIKVTDNGSGIEKSELKKALLPHATSKIRCVEDLDAIMTLGFRGEALASIASVSKMRIASRPSGQEFGASISAEGGALGEAEDYPISSGTEITVRQLFFNTPARAKFLKTPKSEEGDISNIIARFILGNPSVTFRYTADGKPVYQSFGGSLEDALIGIYGVDAVKNCYFVDTMKNGIRISGYLGKPGFSKPNRTYQSLFVNGRYVVNSTVSSAVMNAYGSYLMKRQYPFYVLSVWVPQDEVDVNVHPNKTDVRFSNNQVIYGTIYSVISKVLDGLSEALEIIKEPVVSQSENFLNQEKDDIISNEKRNNSVIHNQSFIASFCDHSAVPEAETKGTDERIFLENKKFIEELERAEAERKTTPEHEKPVPTFAVPPDEAREKQQTEIEVTEEVRIIGQALNTYLIFESGNALYFIDQHAAHERLLYDALIERMENRTLVIQPLLAPYVFHVNHQEDLFLSDKLEMLNAMGIEIENFGNQSYKISALPTELTEMNFNAFFEEIFDGMNALKNISLKGILKDRLAQAACKAAIKSGDSLSKEDIEIILKKMNGNLGLKCPHGRPVAVKVTRTEIDKWFKRIV